MLAQALLYFALHIVLDLWATGAPATRHQILPFYPVHTPKREYSWQILAGPRAAPAQSFVQPSLLSAAEVPTCADTLFSAPALSVKNAKTAMALKIFIFLLEPGGEDGAVIARAFARGQR